MKQVLGELKGNGRSSQMHVAVSQSRMMVLVGRPKHAVGMAMNLVSESFWEMIGVGLRSASMM